MDARVMHGSSPNDATSSRYAPPLEPYCKLAAYNRPKIKTCHQISLTTNKHILTYRPAISHSEKLDILVITSTQLQPSLAT